jgi:hypothetical protein
MKEDHLQTNMQFILAHSYSANLCRFGTAEIMFVFEQMCL